MANITGTNQGDTINGTEFDDTIDGLGGDDRLNGGNGNDLLIGGDGNDTLEGLDGDDTLRGGDGDDSINGGTGADLVSGGAGDDFFFGANGPDTVTYEAAGNAVVVDLEAGTATGEGNDTFFLIRNATGSEFDDSIAGDSTANVLTGGGGNDTTDGRDGDDIIDAGDGDDLLNGGAGNDDIDGGAGNDTLSFAGSVIGVNANLGTGLATQGTETDTISGIENLTGTDRNDTLTGDSGDNLLTGGLGRDDIAGGAGADTIEGGADGDFLNGGEGADIVDGGAGDDRISDNEGGDTIIGGDGIDLIRIFDDSADVVVDLTTGTTQLNGLTGSITGIEEVLTGSGNDLLIGNDDDNRLNATGGQDTILSGGGNDTLIGGLGNALFQIEGGSNVIAGGGAGGSDQDTLDYGLLTGPVSVTMTGSLRGTVDHSGGEQDQFFDVEALNLTDFDDTFQGNSGNDSVDGGVGADTLSGEDGDDTLIGGAGEDSLLGGADNDSLDGGSDDDVLDGGTGDDALLGGDGADTLTGGAGNDTLTGGAGADTFVLQEVGGNDVVTDFVLGEDMFDVSNIDSLLAEFAGQAVRPGEVTVTDNPPQVGTLFFPEGSQTLTFPDGTTVTVPENTFDTSDIKSQNQDLAAAGIVCFVRGTRILTDKGERPIETLRVGDRVQTVDSGLQPIRWIGSRRTLAQGCHAPIRLKAGTIGNHSDLLVSQQHRILVEGWQPELHFGEPEVLVPATGLINYGHIQQARTVDVDYWHIMLEDHALVWANGGIAETLLPGPQALSVLPAKSVQDIMTCLSLDVSEGLASDLYAPARPLIRVAEARLLLAEKQADAPAALLRPEAA